MQQLFSLYVFTDIDNLFAIFVKSIFQDLNCIFIVDLMPLKEKNIEHVYIYIY
jgi:hypothetical protein